MDADLALALTLQFEDDEANCMINEASSSIGPNRPISTSGNGSRPLSVVDESWELIDPVPNIHDLFLQFNDAYFEGKLAGVEVRWSPRMTLCAGICCYEGRGGLCSIRLSQPLLKLRPRKDLVQTLLHEMIHAVLFVTQSNKDHDSHGPEFHKHMYRINKQSGSNITVYHNFHDEVNNYRQHWWKCDGACQSRSPFYGIVRRAMDRAPSKNDTWWADHLRSCGGKFIKIKEPDDYGKKGSKRKRDNLAKDGATNGGAVSSSDKTKRESNDIVKWFSKRVNDGNDSSSSKTIIRTINDSTSGEYSNEKPRPFFSGTGQALGSSSSNGSTSKDQWVKPGKIVKGSNSTTTVGRTINDCPTGEASNDTPRSVFSGTGQSLGSGSNGKTVSKDPLFKPRKTLKDISTTKTVIRTIKDDPLDKSSHGKPRSFFSGSGKNLGSGKKNGLINRDQWINRLIEKQRNTQKISDPIRKNSKTIIPSYMKSEQEKDGSGENRFTANSANDGKNESDLGHHRANRSSKKPFLNSTENYVDVRMRKFNDKNMSGTSTLSSADNAPMDVSSGGLNSHSWTKESSTKADQSSQFKDSMTERTKISIETEDPLIEGIAWRQTVAISGSNNPASYESFKIMSQTAEASPSSKQTDQAYDALEKSAGNDSLIVINESRTSIEEAEELVDCPVCPEKIPISSINLHLDRCLSRCI